MIVFISSLRTREWYCCWTAFTDLGTDSISTSFILLHFICIAEYALRSLKKNYSLLFNIRHKLLQMLLCIWDSMLTSLSSIRVLKSARPVVIILHVIFSNEAMERRDMLWLNWLMIFSVHTKAFLHVCSSRGRLGWTSHIFASLVFYWKEVPRKLRVC